jgi:hypothetical protein
VARSCSQAGKLKESLDLMQTSEEADAKSASWLQLEQKVCGKKWTSVLIA